MGHVYDAADARESLRSLISGQWRAFWMAECVEVREEQNLRQVEGSRSYWSGAGALAMRDVVKNMKLRWKIFFSVEMSKRPSTVEYVARPGL